MTASPTALTRNHPPTVRAWTFFDWANSVYNLIITTAIFPVYYLSATREAFGGDTVNFLGLEVKNSVIYSYAISFSFLMIVVTAPLLSGIADAAGLKKRFMKMFTYLGATACAGLFWFHGANIEYGLLCAILASLGYAGGLVFYNAFLPLIATPDRMDAVSARGFSMGYIGSVLLLIACLVLIMQPEWFGLSDAGQATRVAFLMVALWWAGFAQIPFRVLKEPTAAAPVQRHMLASGIKELRKVFEQVTRTPVMGRFLLSFFVYSMGVQTVMLLAPLFGESEIGLQGPKMILIVLIVQIVAIAGATLFAFLAHRAGSKTSLLTMLGIWLGICIAGYYLQVEWQFYVLAALLGLVMGGIQSVSRSTYARLIPQETTDTASYFSFYDITEKLSIVLGTFSFGYIEAITGSMRNSMLVMALFFLVGIMALLRARLGRTLPS